MRNPERNLRNARGFGIAVLFLAATGLFPAAMVSAQDMTEPRAVLLRMSVNARKAVYEGRKVIIDFSQQVPEITKYQVIHIMPDLERREYSDRGRVVLRKDGWVWNYDPREGLILKKRAPALGEEDMLQQENLNLVMKNYEVLLKEGMLIVGRRSLLVQFEPLERGSRPSRKVWMDREMGLPLRGEVYGVDGTLYLISHYELLRYQPDYNPATFDIKDPNARIVEMESEDTPSDVRQEALPDTVQGLWVPQVLPRGFMAKCLRRTNNREREYQQFYTDGLSSLSFFQGDGERHQDSRSGYHEVFIGPWPGRIYNYGLLRLITWSAAGRHFALVGELPMDEMMRVVKSVRVLVDARRIPNR